MTGVWIITASILGKDSLSLNLLKDREHSSEFMVSTFSQGRTMFRETVTQRKQTEINVIPLKRDWGHRKLTTDNHTSAHFSAHTLLLKTRFPPLLVNSEHPSSVPADIMESNIFFKSIRPFLWLKLNHPEDKQLLAVRVHLFQFLFRLMIATTDEFVICCPWMNNKSYLLLSAGQPALLVPF